MSNGTSPEDSKLIYRMAQGFVILLLMVLSILLLTIAAKFFWVIITW